MTLVAGEPRPEGGGKSGPASGGAEDEVDAGVRVDDAAHLADLQRERRLLERLLHLPRAEQPQVPACGGGGAALCPRRPTGSPGGGGAKAGLRHPICTAKT